MLIIEKQMVKQRYIFVQLFRYVEIKFRKKDLVKQKKNKYTSI